KNVQDNSGFLNAADPDPLPLPAQLAPIDLARAYRSANATGLFPDVEHAADYSVPQPVSSDKLTLPIAIVLLLGVACHFYRSPTYSRLYWSLYGPLDEY